MSIYIHFVLPSICLPRYLLFSSFLTLWIHTLLSSPYGHRLTSLNSRMSSSHLQLCSVTTRLSARLTEHHCCGLRPATIGNEFKNRLSEKTRISAVAQRPRDALCRSVVSFNSTKRRAPSSIISYTLAVDLPLRKLNYVLFSSLRRIHRCVAFCAVNRLAP